MSGSFKNHLIDDCFLNLSTYNTSAVVCCKNRSENLLKALKSWILINEIKEIIILDFGSDIPLKIPIVDDRIKLYRYESEFWHLAKAYNIAIQLSTQPIILKLDCDYFLTPNFFRFNHINAKEFVAGQHNISTRGLLLLHRENFFKVNGYNERIINWGADDGDLYERLVKIGLKEKIVKSNTVRHLPHKEYLRTKYLPNPALNRHRTNMDNLREARKNPWTHLDKMSSYYD